MARTDLAKFIDSYLVGDGDKPGLACFLGDAMKELDADRDGAQRILSDAKLQCEQGADLLNATMSFRQRGLDLLDEAAEKAS